MKAASKGRTAGFNLAAMVLISGGLFSGGCDMLKAPDPEATPIPPPTPRPGVFVPEDYAAKDAVPPPERLNNPTDAAKPSHYELVTVASDPAERAILLSLRSVKMVPGAAGAPATKSVGAPSVMRLSGVAAPVGGAGSNEVFKTIRDWTIGQQLSVEQDKRYPVDLKNRMRVQVFFKGRSGPTKDKELLLNRMLVRSGYAVVNIFEPTSFDTKGWMNDEQYARKQWNPLTKKPGLGLWAWNPSPLVVIGQRLPAPTPTPGPAPVAQPGAPAGVRVNPSAIRNTAPAKAR